MSKQNTHYNFIEFTGIENQADMRFPGDISITKSRTIGLSVRFCQEHGIQSFPYVTLYFDFDPQRRAIALRFTKQRQAKSAAVTFYKVGSATIHAVQFFRWVGIDLESDTGRYD